MNKTGMAHMARSASEMKPNTYKPSPYGYETRLSLGTEQLAKLGIKELPEIGDEYQIVGVAKVIGASQSASERESDTRLELQITHMKLTHEDEVEESAESPAVEKSEQLGAFKLPGMRSR